MNLNSAHLLRWSVALGLGACLTLGAPGDVAAQDDPSDEQAAQQALYTKAKQHYSDGYYAEASHTLELALKLGELNLLYLALGLSRLKEGRCQEALDAHDSALLAPTVPDPPPEAVAEQLAGLRERIEATCPGQLQLECSPSDMTVAIDGGEPQPCPTAPIEMTSGEHQFDAQLGEASIRLKADIRALQTTHLPITLIIPLSREPDREPDPDPDPAPELVEPEQSQLLEWSLIGGGAAVLLGAVIFDAAVLGPAIDDIDEARQDFLAANDGNNPDRAQALLNDIKNREGHADNLVLVEASAFIVGAGLIGVGAALLLWPDEIEDAGEGEGLRVGGSPEGVQMGWRWSW